MGRKEDAPAPTVREQLMTGAVEHIRATGVADLSTRSLATAGGRSTMCLYTKFQNKQGLLDAVYAQQAEALVGRLRSATEPVRALWEFAVTESRVYGFLFDADLDLIGVPASARSDLLDSVVATLSPDPVEGRRRWALLHGMAGLARNGHDIEFDFVAAALGV